MIVLPASWKISYNLHKMLVVEKTLHPVKLSKLSAGSRNRGSMTLLVYTWLRLNNYQPRGKSCQRGKNIKEADSRNWLHQIVSLAKMQVTAGMLQIRVESGRRKRRMIAQDYAISQCIRTRSPAANRVFIIRVAAFPLYWAVTSESCDKASDVRITGTITVAL